MHFDGQWRVGSITPGQGLIVESIAWTFSGGRAVCTWQKMSGDADHR
jgi:hypothetical protein